MLGVGVFAIGCGCMGRLMWSGGVTGKFCGTVSVAGVEGSGSEVKWIDGAGSILAGRGSGVRWGGV